jgi:hypothetical protein
LESPKDATSEFEELWSAFSNDRTINSIFIQDIEPSIRMLRDIRERISAETLQVIESQFIMVAQRTNEWKFLLSEFYKCGNNGAKIGKSFQASYNLIRGSILEKWCTTFCPVLHKLDMMIDMVGKNRSIRNGVMDGVIEIIPLEVGLVVEQIGLKGCMGVAPDLLLLCLREVDGEIMESLLIPVEVKGFKTGKSAISPCENSDYRRGVSLARRQIRSVKDIVRNGFVIEFGLIILCWIHDEQLGMEVHTVPF